MPVKQLETWNKDSAENYRQKKQIWESFGRISWSQISRGDSQREQEKNTNFMNLKILNWYDALAGYDFVYDAANAHRAFLWLLRSLVASEYPLATTKSPQCLPFQYMPSSSICDSALSPQRGRPDGQGAHVSGSNPSHEGWALEDKYYRSLTPHVEWRWGIFHLTAPELVTQQDWPSVAHSGGLLDDVLLTLGTSRPSSHSPLITSQINYLHSNPCLGLCLWENLNYGSLPVLPGLLRVNHLKCMNCLHHFSSSAVLSVLSYAIYLSVIFQNRHKVKNKPPWPRKHKG